MSRPISIDKFRRRKKMLGAILSSRGRKLIMMEVVLLVNSLLNGIRMRLGLLQKKMFKEASGLLVNGILL